MCGLIHKITLGHKFHRLSVRKLLGRCRCCRDFMALFLFFDTSPLSSYSNYTLYNIPFILATLTHLRAPKEKFLTPLPQRHCQFISLSPLPSSPLSCLPHIAHEHCYYLYTEPMRKYRPTHHTLPTRYSTNDPRYHTHRMHLCINTVLKQPRGR